MAAPGEMEIMAFKHGGAWRTHAERKSWLPSVVPARRDCEGWQTQCVHWLVLLSLILHLLLGRASCRHLDRKGDTELADPRPSTAQAQEK